MKYRIWMEELDDLEEGWFCGIGERQNDVFHRTPDKKEADTFDEVNAVHFVKDFTSYGYPCRIIPKISEKRMLEVLMPGGY